MSWNQFFGYDWDEKLINRKEISLITSWIQFYPSNDSYLESPQIQFFNLTIMYSNTLQIEHRMEGRNGKLFQRIKTDIEQLEAD